MQQYNDFSEGYKECDGRIDFQTVRQLIDMPFWVTASCSGVCIFGVVLGLVYGWLTGQFPSHDEIKEAVSIMLWCILGTYVLFSFGALVSLRNIFRRTK